MVNCILISIVSIAACMDLIREKIDNRFLAVCWVLAAGYQAGSAGFKGIGIFLTGSIIPIMMLYVLFRFRMLGAGDIKLLSVIGGIVGPTVIFKCIVLSFLFGALLSLGFVLVCGNLTARLLYFANYINHVITVKKALPYYRPGKRMENIHFTIPILMAVLIHIGGFY